MFTYRFLVVALALCLAPHVINGQTTFFVSHTMGATGCANSGAFAIQTNTSAVTAVANAGVSQLALTLTAGVAYTFTTTAFGNYVCHPFVIGLSATGACGACTPIPTGGPTPASVTTANATITWTPPAALIGTQIFYQCGNHLNMGAQINIVSATPANGTTPTNGTSTGGATTPSSSSGVVKAGASSIEPLSALIVSSVVAVCIAVFYH